MATSLNYNTVLLRHGSRICYGFCCYSTTERRVNVLQYFSFCGSTKLRMEEEISIGVRALNREKLTASPCSQKHHHIL
jgi:hypothetical protein